MTRVCRELFFFCLNHCVPQRALEMASMYPESAGTKLDLQKSKSAFRFTRVLKYLKVCYVNAYIDFFLHLEFGQTFLYTCKPDILKKFINLIMQTHICRQDCYESSLKWDRGDCFCFGIFVQTKKVERDAVSSSESEDEKEDKKMTVSYKSTRSAVSWLFLSYWLFKGCPLKVKEIWMSKVSNLFVVSSVCMLIWPLLICLVCVCSLSCILLKSHSLANLLMCSHISV